MPITNQELVLSNGTIESNGLFTHAAICLQPKTSLINKQYPRYMVLLPPEVEELLTETRLQIICLRLGLSEVDGQLFGVYLIGSS